MWKVLELEVTAIEGNKFIFLGLAQGVTRQCFCGAGFSYLVSAFDVKPLPYIRETFLYHSYCRLRRDKESLQQIESLGTQFLPRA